MKFTIFVFVVCLTTCAFAQNKIPITSSVRADDSVGKAFVYDLKQEIGRSSQYTYVDDTGQKDIFVLSIVTMSTDDVVENNFASVASVVLTVRSSASRYFLDQWVVHVGKERTQSVAHSMMVSIDGDVDEIKKAAK